MMENQSNIREIEVKFPNALRKQIKMLDRLGSMLHKQKEMIEKGEYEELFATRCEKDQIVREIRIQGEGIFQLQQEWRVQKNEIPKHVHENLNSLVTELSQMIQTILTRENQNYSLLERTNNYLEFME
ncbi:MAG: flagellar export chaperone FlgN [Candidatus Zhuqueibacterota bacterium]